MINYDDIWKLAEPKPLPFGRKQFEAMVEKKKQEQQEKEKNVQLAK